MRSHRLIAVLLALLGASFSPVHGDDDVLRMNTLFEVGIASAESDAPVIRCMASTLTARDSDVSVTHKRRILCESPIGPFAIFGQDEIGTTGEVVTVLVDIDSGSWLKIVDQTEIDPRGLDEDKWAWSARLNEIRDHLVTVESSTRLFDPFDAEVTQQARSVLWDGLQESDPTVAALVEYLVENVSNCKYPYCQVLTRSIGEWVYGDKGPASPEAEARMVGRPSLEEPDEHEETDFEKAFGKWGRSFPDPPRLE